MRRDSLAMRGERPTVMTNCFTGEGINELIELIRRMALFDSPVTQQNSTTQR